MKTFSMQQMVEIHKTYEGNSFKLYKNPWETGVVRQTIGRWAYTGLVQCKGITNLSSIASNIADRISQNLGANVLIYGCIKQSGAIIRVIAQLIYSKTKYIFKSIQINGIADNILKITKIFKFL